MIIKTKINSDIIKNLSAVQLDELVYNKAVDLYLGTFGETFNDTENDKLLIEIFATYALDSETKNGGFDKFFTNSYDLTNHVISGLEYINATKHLNVFLNAVKTFNDQKELYLEERNPNLDILSELYYELENIDTLRQKFIKTNIIKFFDQ